MMKYFTPIIPAMYSDEANPIKLHVYIVHKWNNNKLLMHM